MLARQVWTTITDNWERPNWLPNTDTQLVEWWTSLNPQPRFRKETWTVIALVAWMLWKHRNDIMFNGASPSADSVLKQIDMEGQNWRVAALLREAGSLPVRVDRSSNGE